MNRRDTIYLINRSGNSSTESKKNPCKRRSFISKNKYSYNLNNFNYE